MIAVVACLKSKTIVGLKIAFVLLAIIVILGAVISVDIYAYSFISDSNAADAAIVLGAAVWDGEPSPVFEERIEHAINLYKINQVNAIIFTGGVGENDQFAESVVAKGYALQEGISEKNIFYETESRITEENLQGAGKIVKSLGLGRVLVVSDPFHMRRAVLMAQDLGMDAYPSPTPATRYRSLKSKAEFLLRETYFFGLYLFKRLL